MMLHILNEYPWPYNEGQITVYKVFRDLKDLTRPCPMIYPPDLSVLEFESRPVQVVKSIHNGHEGVMVRIKPFGLVNWGCRKK